MGIPIIVKLGALMGALMCAIIVGIEAHTGSKRGGWYNLEYVKCPHLVMQRDIWLLRSH